MANILVTGANGQLGNEIRIIQSKLEFFHRFFYTDVNDLDITNIVEVQNFVKTNSIQLIINCAAYTAVDKAEDPSEKDLVFSVNASAAENLAIVANKNAAWLIHISTDYVFNGNSKEKNLEEPVYIHANSIYGESKRLGEELILNNTDKFIIIRTSWLYSSFGNNFVNTIINLAKERPVLKVVNDQIGSPTYAADFADAILLIVKEIIDGNKNTKDLSGIYHYSNEGICSWYEFAKAILEIKNIQTPILPVTSAKYPTKANRPSFSVLDKSKIKTTFGLKIPKWKDSLKECLKNK